MVGQRIFSAPAKNAVAAFLAGAQYGKRPAEFANNPNYTVLDEGGRFIQVVDNDTGFTEFFWDKEASFAGMDIQIDNVALAQNSHTYQSRLNTYEFMQANQPLDNGILYPSFNPSLRMADGLPVGSPNVNGMFVFDNQAQNWQAGTTSFTGAFWGLIVLK